MRPTIYNRPWHVDADERRHHGRRRWEPAAIEAFVELLSAIDGIYPPDWSDRDVVRFRAAGSGGSFAELWTDKTTNLRLVIHLARPSRIAMDGCRVRVEDDRFEVLLKTPAPLNSTGFVDLIRRAVAQASGQSPTD